MFVRQHMTRNPVTVRPEIGGRRVFRLMREHRLRNLPVVDEDGRCLGLVSILNPRLIGLPGDPAKTPATAGELLDPNPVTVAGDDPIEQALLLMCEHQLPALPVINQGRLEGIITRHDLLLVMCRLLGLDRGGSRIEVALVEQHEDLPAVFAALKQCDTRIVSAIVASTRDDGEEPAVYLRIARPHARVVEHALSTAGLILLEPEEKPVSPLRRPSSSGAIRPALCRANGTNGSARKDKLASEPP